MLLYVLLITHFVADFLMQSREMAQKKSSELLWLGLHIRTITWTFFFVTYFGGAGWNSIPFTIINSAIHALIDWTIWNWYKQGVIKRYPTFEMRRDFKFWEDQKFYSTIGLDQLLHVLTIVVLYDWLIR